MGTGASKQEKPSRSRSGLMFVASSSEESLNTIASGDEDICHASAKSFVFDEITIKSFLVSWNPPGGVDVDSYQVRIFPPDKIKSRTLINALPHPQHRFTRLHSATTYTVGVIARLRNGQKASCSTAQISTLPRPPRDLRFPDEPTSNAIRVKWRHSKGKRDYYVVDIEPSEDMTSPSQVGDITTPDHVFSGLVPGVEYSVSVCAVANGVKSEALSGTIITAPRHVCDVTFTDVTQHEMTVKWRKAEGRVDSYNLELTQTDYQSGEPVVIRKLKELSYTFNGLIPGRSYDCTITSIALNAKSKSRSFSNCTLPAAVSDITARDITPEEVLLTWSPAVGDVEDYDLFLTPKEGVGCNTNPTGVKTTQHKFTKLLPGTTYKVGIVTNSKDKISRRVVYTFGTEPGLSGSLMFDDKERSSNKQLVKWIPSKGRVDSYILYARREDKKDVGLKIEDLYETHYLLKDLTPGTSYNVDVTSLTDGRESTAISGNFATEPLPVTSLTFPPDGCSWDKITCAWQPPGGGKESYKLTLMKEGVTVLEKFIPTDTHSHTYTDLKSSSVYEIIVEVSSNNRLSEPVKGKHKTGPGAISDFRINTLSKRELEVKWSPPDGGAEDYVVTIDSVGEVEPKLYQTCEEVETSHVFKDLTPGTLFKVGVAPRSRQLRGPITTAEAYTKPGDVTNVHIPLGDVTKNSITVTWSGVEGNCRSVDVTLTKIQKTDDEQLSSTAVVVKETHIEECKNGQNELKFDDLCEGTIYGVRLHASGPAGIGDDVVITQATFSSPVQPPPELIQTPPTPNKFDPPATLEEPPKAPTPEENPPTPPPPVEECTEPPTPVEKPPTPPPPVEECTEPPTPVEKPPTPPTSVEECTEPPTPVEKPPTPPPPVEECTEPPTPVEKPPTPQPVVEECTEPPTPVEKPPTPPPAVEECTEPPTPVEKPPTPQPLVEECTEPPTPVEKPPTPPPAVEECTEPPTPVEKPPTPPPAVEECTEPPTAVEKPPTPPIPVEERQKNPSPQVQIRGVVVFDTSNKSSPNRTPPKTPSPIDEPPKAQTPVQEEAPPAPDQENSPETPTSASRQSSKSSTPEVEHSQDQDESLKAPVQEEEHPQATTSQVEEQDRQKTPSPEAVAQSSNRNSPSEKPPNPQQTNSQHSVTFADPPKKQSLLETLTSN